MGRNCAQICTNLSSATGCANGGQHVADDPAPLLRQANELASAIGTGTSDMYETFPPHRQAGSSNTGMGEMKLGAQIAHRRPAGMPGDRNEDRVRIEGQTVGISTAGLQGPQYLQQVIQFTDGDFRRSPSHERHQTNSGGSTVEGPPTPFRVRLARGATHGSSDWISPRAGTVRTRGAELQGLLWVITSDSRPGVGLTQTQGVGQAGSLNQGAGRYPLCQGR